MVKFFHNSSAESCLSTKIKTFSDLVTSSSLPCSSFSFSICPRISNNLRNLEFSSRTSTFCVTSLQTTDLPPTMISKGFFKTLLAKASICRGKVAEKRTTCLSGRILLIIRIT
eukprot:Lithocolla_globosa_v1_NODE_2322_length_2049_cov_6.766800.p3 type:complete len:113 gc:universal NODE_2322_length_2049_cov_6.766800:1677-2015(+)